MMAAHKLNSRNALARIVFWAFLASSLAACGGRSSTPAPEAVFTSAAQTAEARSTEMFALTPTTDPASMVATIAAPTPTATEAVTAAPTQPAAAPTTAPAGGATQPAPPAAATGDAALYVADVTVPDDTAFAPGESFEKTWRIQNSGTTVWTVAYSLIFVDGQQMAEQSRVPLPDEVDPGEEIEVTIPMTAPETPGTYYSYWKMTNANGTLFGFGAAGNEAIWVKISVSGGEQTPEAGLPTGPAPVVAEAQLGVDNAAPAGPCPYTLTFTGQIVLGKAATVTYLLEAGDAAGGSVRTPLPITRNLAQGAHPIVYELTLAESMAGWARLHVTAPLDMLSAPVNFTLTCG